MITWPFCEKFLRISEKIEKNRWGQINPLGISRANIDYVPIGGPMPVTIIPSKINSMILSLKVGCLFGNPWSIVEKMMMSWWWWGWHHGDDIIATVMSWCWWWWHDDDDGNETWAFSNGSACSCTGMLLNSKTLLVGVISSGKNLTSHHLRR